MIKMKTALLREDSPLREVWPDGEVPVREALGTSECELIGDAERHVYFLDPKRCTEITLDNAVWLVIRLRGGDASDSAEIRQQILAGQMPMKASHFKCGPVVDTRFVI